MRTDPLTAARRLDERLRGEPWYLSTGLGKVEELDAIFVYVKSARHRSLSELGNQWMGYRLVVRATGSIRPLQAASHRASTI